MPTTYTPLRYPGGKTKMYKFIREIIELNDLHETYIEPFAGGAGLALKLLLKQDVKRIVINDSDRAIFFFLKCVIKNSDDLCEFIRTVSLDLKTWNKQREIYLNKDYFSDLKVAMATLYLNRTNTSGIIKGGPIGGVTQKGIYKIDARFNRETLIRKIQTIEKHREYIDVFNYDVFDFLNLNNIKKYHNALINFDPPYVNKGGQLYMNFFNEKNHIRLEEEIEKIDSNWIVTYDICELIKNKYENFRQMYIDINYSARTSRKAKELVVFSNNLQIPHSAVIINR